MAEGISLTTPTTPPSISTYTPVSLLVTVYPAPTIVVAILDNAGKIEVFTYPSPPGTTMDTPAAVLTLINTFNSFNFSTRTLWRKVFDRLLLDFPSRFPGGATVT